MHESGPEQQHSKNGPFTGQTNISWGSEFSKLFQYFSSMPVSIQVIKAPEYHYNYVNPAACKLMGRGEDAFVGKHISEILSDAQLSDLTAILENVCRAGESHVVAELPCTFEQQGRSHSGYFTIAYQPLHVNENEIGGVIVNTVEVTDQVTARLALEESEERLRIALESANLGSWNLNEITGEMIVDDLFKQIVGIPEASNLDSQQMYLRVHPEDHQRVKSAVETVLAGYTDRYVQEFRIIHGLTKQMHRVRVTGKARFNVHGKDGFAGTLLDITESKAMSISLSEQMDSALVEWSDELTHIQEELARKDSLVDTILNTSNELIGLYGKDTRVLYYNKKTLELFGLKKEEVIGKPFLELFPKAKDSTSHQLLMRAIGGEPIKNHSHQSTLSGRFYEDTLSPLLDGKGNVYAVLTMSFDITDRLQAVEKEKSTNEALQLINHDLQQFAFVASHDLQEPLRKIETFSNRLYHGIGFPQEEADKIFDMFHRLNTTDYSGSGIELSVCKKIVENHKGIIYASSRINAGASFHILLPVLQNFSADE